MRTLSANSTAAVALTQGVEPVLVVKFNWGGQQWFASKTVGSYAPWISSYSGITSRADLRGSATITTMNLTLQDNSAGLLKTIMNYTNMETVRADVYIYYDGVSGGTPGTLIFEGKITNPISWDEGRRTLTLGIESNIKSEKVGFSIETGQFGINNEIAIGKLWPIVFGKPAHVQALLAEKQPATFLKYAVNMGAAISTSSLYTLASRTFNGLNLIDIQIANYDLLVSHSVDLSDVLTYGKIYVKDSSTFPSGEIKLIIDGVIFRGEFEEPSVFTIAEANAAKFENISFAERVVDDENEDDPGVAWLNTAHISLVDHYLYFEQGVDNNSVYFGGEARLIRKVVRQEGTKIWFEKPLYEAVDTKLLIDETTTIKIDTVRALPQNGLKIDVNSFSNTIKRILDARANRNSGVNPGIGYGQLITQLEVMKFIKNAFWESREDAEVRVWQSNPDIYVCNAVASSSLHSVWGVRKLDERKVFVQIPEHYYTLNLAEDTLIDPEDGPETVTTLRFIEPLSSMKDQGWEDEIYVTVQSTLSDNPATIIKYILDTYTTLDTDVTSFNTVAAQLTGYECHFALIEQVDAIDLVRSIAFQSSIGLIFEGSTVKVTTLMREDTSVKTLSESNIKAGSIKQTSLPTTSIVTQINSRYKTTGEPDLGEDKAYNRQLETLIEQSTNIDLYGLVEEDVNFFIFNSSEQVTEITNFWSHRLGNSWRIAEVTLFHDSMVLEPFDKVQFTMSSGLYLGPSSIKGVVIEINNPVTTGEITYKILLEVKAGQTSSDPNFWTYNNIAAPTNPADAFFETNYDVQIEKEKISLDEFMGRLYNVQRGVSTLGRIDSSTGRNVAYGDNYNVELIHEGVFNDPDGSTEAFIGNPNFDYFDREPIQLSIDPQGTYRANSKFAIVQAQIVSVEPDFLTCKMYDTEAGSDTFSVALPYHLRRTTYDGQTIDGILYQYVSPQNRLNVTGDEDQEITIGYFGGDLIYIGYIPNGTDVVDDNEIPIHYVDLNVDGRTWTGECP